jgi:hypothetical protein
VCAGAVGRGRGDQPGDGGLCIFGDFACGGSVCVCGGGACDLVEGLRDVVKGNAPCPTSCCGVHHDPRLQGRCHSGVADVQDVMDHMAMCDLCALWIRSKRVESRRCSSPAAMGT